MSLYVGVEKDDSSNIFACYAVDELEAREIIIDKFASKEVYSDNFLEYVTDKHPADSINYDFWKINGKYAFNCRVDRDQLYADHVYAKYSSQLDEIDELVVGEYMANIREFFGNKSGYAETFIDYIAGDCDVDSLSEDMLKYICKKLVMADDWTSFIIKAVEA